MASGALLPWLQEIFRNVHVLAGSGIPQERWCGGGAFDFQPHQGVGTQGAGTELDADDPGIWLVLQSIMERELVPICQVPCP